MKHQRTRRSFVSAGIAAALAGGAGRRAVRAKPVGPVFAYPIREPGLLPGDGFIIRVGYACENAADYPGWWHTGENWHRLEGETGGAEVVAAAAGDVLFAGYDYPGPVVILRHGPDLYTQYGHLDYALDVAVGDRVQRGQRLGAVLARTDKPGHLHFEVRTFFQVERINGDAPDYGVSCGYRCPPGPGYWPMAAPEHPSDVGWRNPTHATARRAFPNGVPAGAEVVVAASVTGEIPLWSAPADASGAEPVGALLGRAGDRYPLLAVDAGDEASRDTGAGATRLWYRIRVGQDAPWARAALPSDEFLGTDGRPAAVRFALLPAVS
jgi:hypothetical protein